MNRCRHLIHRLAPAAALLALACPDRALAFKGTEHQFISMAALAIARDCMDDPACRTSDSSFAEDSLRDGDCGPLELDWLEQYALDSLMREESAAVQRGARPTRELEFSYGDIVKDVDFVLDPVALLVRNEDLAGLPRTPQEINQYRLGQLRKSKLTHAWAAQVNDSHFQEELMMGWWLWHRHAVDAAALDPKYRDPAGGPPRSGLYGALLMNAVASHFLEDFFAPGHVVTPRAGLHDYASMIMHDYYNRVGAEFHIERGGELVGLLKIHRDAPRLAMTEGELQRAAATIAGNPTIVLRGDSELLSDRGGKGKGSELEWDPLVQRTLVALVVARSIVDVFRSFTCEQPVNSFPGYEWSAMRPSKSRAEGQPPLDPSKGRLLLARGGMAFGHYVEKQVPHIQYGLILPLEISIQSSPWAEDERSRGILSAMVLPTFIYAPTPGKLVAEGGTQGAIYEPQPTVFTLGLGMDYRLDEDLGGIGFFTRGALLLPRLDLHVGLGLGLERYPWRHEASWRFHPEVRVGVGASFLTVFLALGYDHDLDAEGELRGSPVVRTGINFGVPWRRAGRLLTRAH